MHELDAKWAAKDWDRLKRERGEAVRRAEELARENGLLRAKLRWLEEDRRRDEFVRDLQRKISKQSRRITQLEARAQTGPSTQEQG